MEIQELATKLGFDTGVMNGDKFVITLKDSDEYAKAYTKLDASELTEFDGDASLTSEHNGEMNYVADGFDITLSGDFDKDIYSVVIEPAEGKHGA